MPNVIWWALILFGVILVGFYAVVRVKRWVTKPDDGPSAGFSLSDLRAMHRNGQISTEEFEKAKTAIVAAAQRAIERQEEERKERERR